MLLLNHKSHERLKELQVYNKDLRTEEDHIEADRILCYLLRGRGCGDVVDEFDKIEKWYR